MKGIIIYFCSSFFCRKIADKSSSQKKLTTSQKCETFKLQINNIPTCKTKKQICKLIVLFWQTVFASENLKWTKNIRNERERNRNKTFLIHTEYVFRFWNLKRGKNCFTIRTELQVKILILNNYLKNKVTNKLKKKNAFELLFK